MPPMMAASPRTPTTTPAAIPAVLGPFFSGSEAGLETTAELAGAAELDGVVAEEAADDDEETSGGSKKGISLRELPVDMTHSLLRPPPAPTLTRVRRIESERRLTHGPVVARTCR